VKRIVHIGGDIGNHLLRYFIAVADSMENSYEIGAVVVTCAPNRLVEILELKIPTVSRPEEHLNEVKHNVEENIHMLFKYRSRIFEEGWVKLKTVEDFINAGVCIHLRGKDKKVAPLQWYCDKAKNISGRIYVCTDDREFGNRFMTQLAGMKMQKDIVFTYQSVTKDWYTILGADEVYCSVSSFPLSTLLFDSNKKMIVCSRESSTRDYQIGGTKNPEFQFVETAMNYCPNLCFED